MSAENPHHRVKQPYPWLEAFGFRIADRVSTLQTTGEWTFAKANGQPATDMADAAVGTSDDPHDELAWTDAAVQENERLRASHTRAQSKVASLRAENKTLRRKLQASEKERDNLQRSMDMEREKMKVCSGA